MTKNIIKYIHPVVGEVWIDKSSSDYELLTKKNRSKDEQHKLDGNIQTEFYKCYGGYEL